MNWWPVKTCEWIVGFILEIYTNSDNLSQRDKSLNYSHTIVVQNVTLTDDTP